MQPNTPRFEVGKWGGSPSPSRTMHPVGGVHPTAAPEEQQWVVYTRPPRHDDLREDVECLRCRILIDAVHASVSERCVLRHHHQRQTLRSCSRTHQNPTPPPSPKNTNQHFGNKFNMFCTQTKKGPRASTSGNCTHKLQASYPIYRVNSFTHSMIKAFRFDIATLLTPCAPVQMGLCKESDFHIDILHATLIQKANAVVANVHGHSHVIHMSCTSHTDQL